MIFEFRVDSLNVRDDTEIDWKTLPDPGWNFWSAHSLQRRWLTLKRSIKGFEEMTHAGQSFTSLKSRFKILFILSIGSICRNHGYSPTQKSPITDSAYHFYEKEGN
jgi:hypothetical protein